MTRLPRLAAVLAVVALMVVMVPAAASAKADSGPTATASKRCKVGNDRGYGTTYVRGISSRRTSCGRARTIVRSFHRCRKGAKGRCRKRVRGFRCRENRNSGVGSFDSKVTCRRGGRRVSHSYTQFT